MTAKTTKTPIYKKIKSYIREKIDSGEWPSRHQIPSEAEFVTLFQTSRMTVNRAMTELVAEHLLQRRQGAGTFVAPPRQQAAFLEITPIAEEIRLRGGRYSCRVLHLGRENASTTVARLMKLAPYSEIFHSQIVHSEEGLPVQLAVRYINPQLAPDYLDQNYEQRSPSEYLLETMPSYEAKHVIEAVIPEKWIRDLLQINGAEPCLCLTRITRVNDVIATLSYFYYPGSRYSFGGVFRQP